MGKRKVGPCSEERKNKLRIRNSGAGNPFYGRHHSEEARKKMSEARKGKPRSEETKKKLREALSGMNHYNYGKHLSESTRIKISISNTGTHRGENSSYWKGGVTEKNIPLYDTYAHQISWCEEVRRDPEDVKILQVRCSLCKQWYSPTRQAVYNRITTFKKEKRGEARFYCSEKCKQLCPIYNRQYLYKFQESHFTRGIQAELRQLVFEKDDYKCIKCGSNKSLHCHHKEGIRWEPLESADIDMCITLCKNCHEAVHKIEGCTKSDMRCDQ